MLVVTASSPCAAAAGRRVVPAAPKHRPQRVCCVATGPRSSSTRRSPPPPAPSVQAAPAQPAASPPHVPRSIEEVDNGQILGFSSDLSEDHPGFHDPVYKQRRVDICNLARTHRTGEPIPRIEYTAEEAAVWGTALRQLRNLFPQHACKEFLRCWPLFDFREDTVPQLEDLSAVLQATTGFRIRPVAGLLHPRDFLNGLAFRTFHSTQYLRHPSRPDYTPEPDLVHEVIGHVPMLADPAFADLVHAIGLASLGADEKQIWHLTKIYWYTVEFGVVREGQHVKAFGAGILSSYGELRHMASGAAALESLDVFAPQPRMSYKDGYQRHYFAVDSLEAGAAQLRAYCATLHTAVPQELHPTDVHLL